MVFEFLPRAAIGDTREKARLRRALEAIKGELQGKLLREDARLSSDPADPPEGGYVLWLSDGTGAGDTGDLMIKITDGGVTKTGTLVDFSAL